MQSFPCPLSLSHSFISPPPTLPVEVAHQFQYAVRVIGSNYAPTIERDEFLVSEKIKKECKFHPATCHQTTGTQSRCVHACVCTVPVMIEPVFCTKNRTIQAMYQFLIWMNQMFIFKGDHHFPRNGVKCNIKDFFLILICMTCRIIF